MKNEITLSEILNELERQLDELTVFKEHSLGSRQISIAITKLEESIMWLKNHLGLC